MRRNEASPDVRARVGLVSLLSHVADVWDVGLVAMTTEHAVDFVSDRARVLLDVASESHPVDRWERIRSQVARHLRRYPAAEDGSSTALEIDAAPGSTRDPIRCRILPIVDPDAPGYLLVIADSDRAPVHDVSRRQASKYRALASLHRDSVHDLKGMFNVVSLSLELLLHVIDTQVQDAEQRESAHRRAKVLRQALFKADRAIDVLLDGSTLEHPGPVVCDARTICSNLLDLVGPRCRRQHVDTSLDLPDDPAPISGFPDRLHLALLNLAINALDAMPRGGALAIAVHADDEVRISLSDTGPGLDDTIVQDLCRASRSTPPDGHGLGLQVVRDVIREHRGRLEYQTSPTGGARFTLHLPAATPQV